MDAVVFADWWDEYLRKHRGDRDSGERAIHEFLWYVRTLNAPQRSAFVAELIAVVRNGAPGSHLALEVLETQGSSEEIRALWQATPVDPQQPFSDRDVAVLRVVAKRDSSGPAAHVLRHAIREAPIGPGWTSLAWALWPHEPDLFGEAWTRYFQSQPPSQWQDTVVPQSFLPCAHALHLVMSRLEREFPEAWEHLRAALAAQHQAPWLSASEREALMHALA